MFVLHLSFKFKLLQEQKKRIRISSGWRARCTQKPAHKICARHNTRVHFLFTSFVFPLRFSSRKIREKCCAQNNYGY